MDHSELIAEMAYIEKLSTQERLKLARRRRMQQLKKCSQREKEYFYSKKEKTALNEAQKRQKKNIRNVCFANNVMILEAAARNDIEEVKTLLEMSVNPDSTNEDGLTALHQCCIDDSEEMMRLLVNYGANVNAQDSEKWTPLHAAATCGHLHLAKFLISQGANLLAVNADGNMPYDICEDDATLDYIEGEMAGRGVTQQLIDDTRATVERKMLLDLKKLKEEGKSLMFRDEQGATPLHIASANGYIQVVDYLLSQNTPTEVQDNDDWYPLHAAACWGHPDVLELLVHTGANLQARTKNQETPYDICEDAELRERIIQLINEQETKRIHDQNRRIRRVRSNKRTQSIRRTSVREKTLTAKKDAQEEARMRIHLENHHFNKEKASLPDLCPGNDLPDSTSPKITTDFSSYDNNNKTNELKARNLQQTNDRMNEEIKRDLEFKNGLTNGHDTISSEISKEEKSDVIDAQKEPIVSVIKVKSEPSTSQNTEIAVKKDEPPPVPPRVSSVKSDASGSKIDIHVTVTVNPFSPGTLSDLKKQRALSRASQNSFTLSGGSNSLFSVNSNQELESNTDNVSSSDSHSKKYAIPSSPTLAPRRFCGTASEIVGKNDTWSCCTLI